MKKVLVLLVISLVSFQLSVFGQNRELNYEFSRGQTIRIEHMFEKIDTLGHARPPEPCKIKKKQKIKILDFKVLGKSKQVYKMSMHVVSSFGRTVYHEGYGDQPDTYNTGFDSTAFSLINFADQGREFLFEMDTKGRVLKIEGIQEFQNEVIQKINAMGRQSMKARVRYEYILSRISESYYSQLINEVFPDVHEVFTQNPSSIPELIFPDWKLKITNNWNKVNTNHRQLNFNRKYVGAIDSLELAWESRFGNVFWNAEKGLPDSVVCAGYDMEEVLMELWGMNVYFLRLWIKSNVDRSSKGETTTRKIGGQKTTLQNAMIVGEIHGCDSCLAIVKFPSEGIRENELVYNIYNQGQKIIVPGDLPNGPGLVTIYFPKNYERFKSYENDPRQIRIYIRPGDTVNFSVDLRRFGRRLEFQGKTWREQELLNSYILGYSNINPKITLEDIGSAKIRFEKEKPLYVIEFRKWFENEIKYEELEYRLNVVVSDKNSKHSYNSADSLNQFFKYCNAYQGYASPAYMRFITRIASGYGIINNLDESGNSNGMNLLETASSILSGWDRYYVLARLTQSRMRTFYRELSESYYKYYISHYKGSEFGTYLEDQWKNYALIMPGEKIRNFTFRDYLGVKHELRDFTGTDVIISPVTSMPKKPRFQNIPIGDYPEKRLEYISILYYLGTEPANKDTITAYGKKEQIWVTEEKSINAIMAVLANRNDLKVTIDKDQRIAYYSENSISGLSYSNLYSWPQLEEEIDPPKTINRFILWYTSTGLITLAIFLFIIFRIRSKKREARQALNRRMAELELGAVRSRMNPHFLFNALGSIQNLVNGNEIEKANLYLADFGDLVRSILDQSSKNQITLAEEINTLRTYLDLEQLRFPFFYSIKVDEEIIPERVEIPPLFIQPHVENAIIHGLSKLGKDGVLGIEFSLDQGNLEVLVEDNGEGINSGRIESKGLGQGWKLTNQRVQLLKEQWGKNISVEMMKDEGKSGMRVKFVIPVESKA